ncbi:hypothetical protein [Helicobacter burdigaliensis]|uniref:hypothetical protein n=1 Tax=Helicobacter burdigaliensis TaxID=2315334 RepID=UPI000EF6C57D
MKSLFIYILLALIVSLSAQNTDEILKEILNKDLKENFSKTPKGEEFFNFTKKASKVLPKQ